MNCPACNRIMEPKTAYVCRQCWWKVPVVDRRMLGHMHRRKQNTDSKLAKIVRDLKAKQITP